MRQITAIALVLSPLVIGSAPASSTVDEGAALMGARSAADHWLVRHQSEDGRWDADAFTDRCPEGESCDGAGTLAHDEGVTGLALLAFLGAGSTAEVGPARESVARGISWLRSRQAPDTGLIGDASSPRCLRDHALATVALAEAYYFGRSPLLEKPVRQAVAYLERSRSADGGWHGAAGDVTATGWAIMALTSARSAGIEVDEAALDHGRAWVDGLARDDEPRTLAVGLLGALFLGREPGAHPEMKAFADRLLAALPAAEGEKAAVDEDFLYFGSYAMYQMGGRHWKAWNKALKHLVLDTQLQQGATKSTWSPVGSAAREGGRVYSTSTMILCLEVYFRYAKIIGAR